MKASDLGLAEPARSAALALEEQFPGVVFTSGRRGLDEQARAMASNIVKRDAQGHQHRNWIAQTYLAAQPLQAWVDAHPEAVSQDSIAHGLVDVMADWTDAQKAKISRHFSGQAFDVQPVSGPRGSAIKAAIRALPKLQKFLETEGGLIRWHAQF